MSPPPADKNAPYHSPVILALLGAYTLVVSHGVGRFLYTANLPTMLAQTELNTIASGYLASVNYAGYLLGAIVAMLVSRQRSLVSVQVGIVLSIVTTFMMMSVSSSLWYIARFVSGLASGLILVNGSTLILSQFSAGQRTVLTAIYYAGVGVGIIVSSAIVYAVLQTSAAYMDIWLIGGIISLPTLWIVQRFRGLTITRQTIQAHHIHRHAQRDRRLIIVSYALGGFGYITAATFLPVIVLDAVGTEVTWPHLDMFVWLVVGVAAACANPIWGKLAQSLGEVPMLLAAMLMQVLGLLIPVYFATVSMLCLAALLFGGSFMAVVSLSMGAVKHLSAKRVNFFLGLATVCYSIGQMLGPMVTVWLFGHTGTFDTGLWVAAAVYVLAGCCLLPLLLSQTSVDV